MRQEGQSTFNVTVNGETVSIPLEKARALCPDEVAAMEEAGEAVSRAAEANDDEEYAKAGQELQKRAMNLFNALVEAIKNNGD